MLIPSHRHTEADLRLWRELEGADFALAELPTFGHRVERSLAAIREFVKDGPCYCGVSWGKDSVAAAHLLRSVAIDVPIVNLRVSPTRNPECDSVRDAYFQDFPGQPYHEEPVDYGNIDRALPLVKWDRETYRLWDAAWRRVVKRFGGRHISGVRGSENASRMMRMRIHGENSPRTCAPLAWWSVGDVFAYLAVNRLPVNATYAMVGGGRWPRERLRTSELGDAKGTGAGRAEWEREYYGDVLNRLDAPHPCMPRG